jgi:DNA-binding IclR family transcriptional regulator
VYIGNSIDWNIMSSGTQVRGRRPPHGEPVLDRAFRILGAFGPAHRTLSLTSLSVRAGLPKATTLRLARKLVEWGALERTEDGEYTVGLRLLEVASLAPRGHGLRATALPYLEDLHHATGQHVLLAVRDGHEAVLVERLSARGAGRVLYRVGGRMPLHSTGVGLVLLAHAPLSVQEEVLARPIPCPDRALARPIPWPDRALAGCVPGPDLDLRARLATVRHDGVAIMSRPRPEPMTSVACPITDQSRAGQPRAGAQRSVVAAVSVITRSEQIEPAVLTPAVIAVARAISRALSAAPQ